MRWGKQQISASSDSAKLDSQLLLAFCLDRATSYLLTWPDKLVEERIYQQFSELVAKRVEGHPIAYLLGEKEFWSLSFYTEPSTLIPRPDTEVLVEIVLDNHPMPGLHCLDLGTGTGAIAIALASELPCWQFEAVDFQEKAVALAKRNQEKHKISNLDVYLSDWFANVSTSYKFDVIVSNPPYIDEDDHHLSEGDVRFEPLTALVAPKKGLGDIMSIIKEATSYLRKGGFLYFEHGFEQGQAVRDIFIENGYSDAKTVQDYNGNDRVTYATWR